MPTIVLVPIIPMEDELLHRDDHPFCGDSTCPCHKDMSLIEYYLYQPFQNGLLTFDEAERLFVGEQV